MDRQSNKVDALAILEWNEGGHHESYLNLYVASLLASGRRLVVLCRNPEQLMAGLIMTGVSNSILDELLVVERMPGLSWLDAHRAWPRFLRYWAYANHVGRILKMAEKRLGERCHSVFFSCLYEHQTRAIMALVARARRPWCGLYLQASAFHFASKTGASTKGARRLFRLLADSRLKCLLMLDEGISNQVATASGRPVILVPDVTDASIEANSPLAVKARVFAGSKPLVGLMGHLLPSKGTATLATMSMDPEAADLAFLFAGEIHWEMFSAVDKQVLTQAMQHAPGAMFCEARIPDERSYNALLKSCDVLFAAYHDFPFSSNTLTKAAVFEKPVIVSAGHLMASRVREYRMGEIVPAGDVKAALDAIHRITHDPEGWRHAMQPRWSDYRQRHSTNALKSVMQDFLSA